ncbi:MAG: hypothetical protein M3Q50_13005 [Chloroflexota bacterium]|nr:hypothetical protein [Chloroflexota bacterium]
MIDPVTASNDRLRETGRWGYTGDLPEDQVPVAESGAGSRRLLWWSVLAIAAIVVIAPFTTVL